MPESETDPAIMVVLSLAAVTTLFAWWLSARRDQRTRRLIDYLKQHQASYWRSLPWLSRTLSPASAIEGYRRKHQAGDPAFAALYAARRSASRASAVALLVPVCLIAIVLIGTTLLDWRW
jgi:hypothetical protein